MLDLADDLSPGDPPVRSGRIIRLGKKMELAAAQIVAEQAVRQHFPAMGFKDDDIAGQIQKGSSHQRLLAVVQDRRHAGALDGEAERYSGKGAKFAGGIALLCDHRKNPLVWIPQVYISGADDGYFCGWK